MGLYKESNNSKELVFLKSFSKTRNENKEKLNKALTSLALAYIWSILTMCRGLKVIKTWHIGPSHSRSKLQNEGASYTNIKMAIHHHKLSTELARARQIRGYQSHLDLQIHKREVEKIRIKKKKNVTIDWNQITIKERRNFTGVTLTTTFSIVLPWNFLLISVT